MNIGDKVKILEPFQVSFPGNYTIVSVTIPDTTYRVDIYGDGIGSDFDAVYLEAA